MGTQSKLIIETNWANRIKGFKAYLRLERGRSEHTVEAYERDVRKLPEYLALRGWTLCPDRIERLHLDDFLTFLAELGLAAPSQARLISALRTFFQYLLEEEIITTDPTELLRPPKLGRKIPEVLTYQEMQQILAAIDLSTDQGVRDRAMLETLYACGLRVSELTGLRLGHVYPDQRLLRVVGKGNKERIVPIGETALKHIHFYLEGVRQHLPRIQATAENILFLNRRGGGLSRVAVFTAVKAYTEAAGVSKNVSPHSFRHAFATHLIEGGADLKAVQDMLGHESITTTEIYTHLDTDYLRETILSFHPANKR